MSDNEIMYVGSLPAGDHDRGLLLARLMTTDDRYCGMAGTTTTAITARDVQNLCAAVRYLEGCIDKMKAASIVPEPGPAVEYEE